MGLWAAVHRVNALTASPGAFRAYLLKRTDDGADLASLRLAVLRKLQVLADVEVTASEQVMLDTIWGSVNRAGSAVPRQAASLMSNVLAAEVISNRFLLPVGCCPYGFLESLATWVSVRRKNPLNPRLNRSPRHGMPHPACPFRTLRRARSRRGRNPPDTTGPAGNRPTR